MSFTEVAFLPFLATVLILQFLLKKHSHRIIMLCLASYIFYGWWNIEFLGLIIFSSLVDYILGARIYNAKVPLHRKLLLALSLTTNLGLLGVFKYTNFFIDSLNTVAGWIGVEFAAVPMDITLPVGISFYTFQTLSYTLDIYRGNLNPEERPTHFFFFVAAFPQLVAGPIVRAADFLPQLRHDFRNNRDYSGVGLILYGLFKKLVLADTLGYLLVDKVFADPSAHSGTALWIGIYAYAFQIFLDFSAYSDIAIGVGKLLGLEFPLNFNAPYIARNIGDFWQRWHISLSTWFRDYLYLPLGGNRVSLGRWCLNIAAVFLLSGLWHGANITFVLWGGIHGTIYMVERWLTTLNKQRVKPLSVPVWCQVFITFHLVVFAWIFFRAQDLANATEYLSGLIHGGFSLSFLADNIFALVALATAAVLHVAVEPHVHRFSVNFTRAPLVFQSAVVLALGIAAYATAEADIAHAAFIYFQF